MERREIATSRPEQIYLQIKSGDDAATAALLIYEEAHKDRFYKVYCSGLLSFTMMVDEATFDVDINHAGEIITCYDTKDAARWWNEAADGARGRPTTEDPKESE